MTGTPRVSPAPVALLLTLLATGSCGGGGDTAPQADTPVAGDAPFDASLNQYGNPLRVAYRPTTPAITAEDLRTRVYAFAHDSMAGRMAGREGNRKATAYLARELERIGLEPAGEDGGWFQELPFVLGHYLGSSTLTVDGQPLRWLGDFVAVPGAAPRRGLSDLQVIYGGVVDEPASWLRGDAAENLLVVFTTAGEPAPAARGRELRARFAAAAAVAIVDLETLGPSERAFLNDPAGSFVDLDASPGRAPVLLRITPEAAEILMGRPLGGLEVGTRGRTADADLDYVVRPVPEYARNVVAVLRGSDPTLASEYVALGAHNDHVGFTADPVDHDSARTHAAAVQALRIRGGELRSPTTDELAAVAVDTDSLRALRPPRPDSIHNGADDDGSGSMALLEIAEALAAAPAPPRRSILFVWHTSEERGLQGSRWFVEHPTVPLDSVVALLNMDMIGRGRAEDVPGGSDDLLFVIGSYRDSRELGELVAGVNRSLADPLELDYRLDEPTDWPGYNNLYGRSDHVNYARAGVPIAFFFTGLHHDCHRPTDEPQYVHYPKLERIASYVRDVAVEVANRERRPALEGGGGGGAGAREARARPEPESPGGGEPQPTGGGGSCLTNFPQPAGP